MKRPRPTAARSRSNRRSRSRSRRATPWKKRTGELRAAESGYFPRLDLFATYQRQIRSEYDDLFDDAPAMDEAAALQDLPFASKNSYRLGAALTQNLYAGGSTRAAARQARALSESARLDVTMARAKAVLDVARAYYDAVLADRFVTIAELALAHAE
jgi:outer membrane protein TolC